MISPFSVRPRPSRRTILIGSLSGLGAPALIRPGLAQGAAVKVGVILPTSGALAFPGQASLRGIRLGETVVREAGGVLIGVAEAAAALAIDPALKSAFSYGLLVLILLLRPAGLIAARAA